MQSETIGALAAALAKAQGAIKPAAMDRDNPFFKSRYATLTSLWEAARDALSANGLAVTQATDVSDGEIVLITTLLHSSGEWIGGVYPVRATDAKPQSLGSAITYARRYAFGALVGLIADDDDDGNAASAPAQKAPVKAQNGGGVPKPTMPVVEQPIKRNDNLNTPDNGHTTGTDDNPFASAEAAALRKLHAIGATLYAAEWDAKRHAGALWASNKRTNSSKQLTLPELNKLIAELEDRQRQAATV